MIKAIIKLDYSCNNNCIFCHAVLKKKSPRLPLKEIKQKILKAQNMGVEQILLSGGEPTLRKDLWSITEFIRNNGLKYGLVTNGVYLAQEGMVEKLKKEKCREIYLSLHAGSPLLYKKITGTDYYKNVIKALGLLKSSRIAVMINAVVLKDNLRYLSRIIDI
jgi:MoaA/NifB/PqqE/SkfB family radical SAM enzyme